MPSTYTLAGFVFNNAGKAVSSAEISIFKANTTTNALSTTVTNASGFWSAASSSFSAVDGGFDVDVQITNAATGAVGRIKHKDRIMTEAVIAREIFLSPDSNDSTDVSRGFFTKVVATADQGEEHLLTLPKLTGSPLVTATVQDSNGAITLSSLETITTAGDITMSSGTLTVGGNFTVSSLGVVTSSGQITAASSLAVSSGGFDVGGGNFTVSSAGVTTVKGAATFSSGLDLSSGTLTVGGKFTVSSAGVVTSSGKITTTDALEVGSSLLVTGVSSFADAVNIHGLITGSSGLTLSSGTLDVGGNFTADSAGAVTIGSSLLVTGVSSFTGAVTMAGKLTVNDSIVVTGGASITGTLTVAGNTTINDSFFVFSPAVATATLRSTDIPADGANVTLLNFEGSDSGAVGTVYGRIITTAEKNETGNEAGGFEIHVATNGNIAQTAKFTGDTAGNLLTGLYGVTPVVQAANSTVNDAIRTALVNVGIMAP